MSVQGQSRPGPPLIDGYAMDVPADSWQIRPIELRTAERLATNRLKQFVLAGEPEEPEVIKVRDFGFSWSSYQSDGVLKRLLSRSTAAHSLVLWRVEYLSWIGNGSRRHFKLPAGWTLAVDGAPSVPVPGLAQEKYNPQFRLAFDGDPLIAEPRSAVDYEAAEPPAGTVWWQRQTGDFKLSEPIAKGAPLYGDVIPVYRVIQESSAAERSIAKPLVEPFELRLLEDREKIVPVVESVDLLSGLELDFPGPQSFDGTSAEDLDQAAEVLPPMTLAAYLRPTTSSEGTLISRRFDGTMQWQWYLLGSELLLRESDGGSWSGGASKGTATTAVTDGVWQHVAVTADATGAVIFYRTPLGGSTLSESGSQSSGFFELRPTLETLLGARRTAPFPATAWHLTGDLATVRVYSRALTAGEISALAAQDAPAL